MEQVQSVAALSPIGSATPAFGIWGPLSEKDSELQMRGQVSSGLCMQEQMSATDPSVGELIMSGF